MSQSGDTSDKSFFQQGIVTPQIVEYVDTESYRHFLYCYGNPVLKYVIDSRQEEIRKLQEKLEEEILERNHEKKRKSYYNDLMVLEQFGSSTELFDYSVMQKANSEADIEIKNLKEANADLKNKIRDLKQILGIDR